MATQKGRNWSSGDIVTAANLSSIERGVSAVAEEYTPTTWANGNTVTAAALNNIEQGIANAGGGSSDFSTATVTVVNNTAQTVVLDGGISGLSEGYAFVWRGALKTRVGVQPNSTGTFTALLLSGLETSSSKGAAYTIPFEDVTITTNGDCIRDWDSHEVLIYGDCTITISSGQVA